MNYYYNDNIYNVYRSDERIRPGFGFGRPGFGRPGFGFGGFGFGFPFLTGLAAGALLTPRPLYPYPYYTPYPFYPPYQYPYY
ncbi:hypothetical protein JOC75_002078 [Metabacillus crassostreae]|uniref:spore coat protein n=1 Tax=Metabacillus crassostreae TaxID=929098 RepID=UPI0019585F94|nr:spore coat protein [Metabacillus crassostreae]MBM7604105.1 hypothetical protein [Metabacillus crassostreae]